MIAHLRGKIEEKFGNFLTIDVNGVGYEIAVPTPDFEAAKKIFELLISVQGIGPKAAIAILSLAEAEEVRNAIANADAAFISKASGVGKKSAERVIVDLRDKVGIPSHYGATETKFATVQPANDEALDALIALGFPLKEATAALEKVDLNLSVEERVRLALKG